MAIVLGLTGALAMTVGSAHASVNCGETITVDTVLTHDLNCTGDGVIIGAPDITFDLGGFTIDGDEGSSDKGVLIEGRDGVTVKNGRIQQFGDGVRVRDATGVTLRNLWIVGNVDDGVAADDSPWLTLSKVRANDNGAHGADFSRDPQFRIGASIFNNNGNDAVIVDDGSDDGSITNSVANDNGADGFETEESKRIRIVNNTARRNHFEGVDTDDNDYGIVSRNIVTDGESADGYDISDAVGMKVTYNKALRGGDDSWFDIERVGRSVFRRAASVRLSISGGRLALSG